MKTFLVTYQHDGGEWVIELKANDFQDARSRVAKLAYARLDGELMAKVHAPLGPLARLAVRLRNLFTTSTPQTR